MEEIDTLVLAQGFSSNDNSAKRASIVEMVRRWGGSTADAVLDKAMQYFQHPDIQGFIGYRPEMKCAICFGDPVCAPADREALSRAFHQFADEKGYRVIYIAASQDYAQWVSTHLGASIIEFGKEQIFAPPFDPRKSTGTQASLVRRKTKQAHREGVTIHEYIPSEPLLEEAIEEVKTLWLNSRRGIQVHISNVYLFTDSFGKRWFYAKLKDRVIGVIALNRMQAREGWLLNHLMVIPDAPNGVPELLMATVLETLEKEGCPFATVGSIAAHELGEIRGLSPLSTRIARIIFKIASKVIKLKGLNTFWGKFLPQSQPSYLIFSRGRIGLLELLSLKKAMNGTLKGGKNA